MSANAPQENFERLSEKLLVIGHRGAAGLAPENTLAAFSRALEIGVDVLEMDVLLTADREVVVHHDFRLKSEITRTQKGEWLEGRWGPAVKDLTLAELKTYDVGRLKPGATYSYRYPQQQPMDGERIPTLREVISLLKEKDDDTTQLWIEIKTSPKEPDLTESPEAVADVVLQLLREEDVTDRVSILSFDWRSLVYFQKTAPDISTVYVTTTTIRSDTILAGRPGPSPWTAGLDVDDYDGSIPSTVMSAGGRYWAPKYHQITPELVQETHRLGILITVWTVDSPQDMVRFMRMGVDGIITNRPDLLKSVCEQGCP